MRPGANRHCRTASTARSFSPPRSPRMTHVADRAVTPHDDLELDLAFDVGAPRLVGVVGAHFAQQPRRLDAAARTEGTAAVAAAGSVADAGAIALAEARATAGADAAAGAGPLARRASFGASANSPSRPACQPVWSESAPSPAAAASLRAAWAVPAVSVSARSAAEALRAGSGLLIFWIPLRSAFGGGAFIFSPPPPPPPPGPGDIRNTIRIGSFPSRISALIGNCKTKAGDKKTVATASPCRLVDTISGSVVVRCDRAPGANSSRPSPSAPGTADADPLRSAFTARTASSCATKSASRMAPRAKSRRGAPDRRQAADASRSSGFRRGRLTRERGLRKPRPQPRSRGRHKRREAGSQAWLCAESVAKALPSCRRRRRAALGVFGRIIAKALEGCRTGDVAVYGRGVAYRRHFGFW